jgi:hypothetical protein
MRDPRVRVAFVALILAFPILMVVTAGRPLDTPTLMTLVLVENILIVGLFTVAKTRSALLAPPPPDAKPTPAPLVRLTRLGLARSAIGRLTRGSTARPTPAGVRRRPG